jgi:uncharacterized protein YjcR
MVLGYSSTGEVIEVPGITEEIWKDIAGWGSAMSAKKLAEKYGVHVGTIYKILQGTRWNNVN